MFCNTFLYSFQFLCFLIGILQAIFCCWFQFHVVFPNVLVARWCHRSLTLIFLQLKVSSTIVILISGRSIIDRFSLFLKFQGIRDLFLFWELDWIYRTVEEFNKGHVDVGNILNIPYLFITYEGTYIISNSVF